MNKLVRILKAASLIIAGATIMSSCGGSSNPTSADPGTESTVTGVPYSTYNEPGAVGYDEDGGFIVSDFQGQPDGPNLVFIEGGRAVLGSFEEDLLKNHNSLLCCYT